MKLPFRSFKFLPKTFLGVDIGTSAIKVVELKRWGERRSLKNYAELQSSSLYDKPFRTFEKNTLLLSKQDIADMIRYLYAVGSGNKLEAYAAIARIAGSSNGRRDLPFSIVKDSLDEFNESGFDSDFRRFYGNHDFQKIASGMAGLNRFGSTVFARIASAITEHRIEKRRKERCSKNKRNSGWNSYFNH